MPGVDFQLLRQRITMQDVLQQLPSKATLRRGDQWRGPCPIHGSQETGESFVFGERAAGTVPLLPLRIARQCVGAMGGGAPFRAC